MAYFALVKAEITDEFIALGGKYFLQDDMLLPMTRNGIKNRTFLWTDGIIPYVFSKSITIVQRNMILNVIEQIHQHTIVRFEPKSQQHKDWVLFKKNEPGCFSNIGNHGGRQAINLDDNCYTIGKVFHQIVHTIGFYHEHSRRERDNFVTIHWENIEDDKKPSFLIPPYGVMKPYGTVYDYESIMHYDSYAFSKNGLPTIVPHVRLNIIFVFVYTV